MISRKPFLSQGEALDLTRRVLDIRHLGWKDNLDIVIGAAGISAPEQRFSDHEARIVNHNALMNSSFPDILEKLKVFYESLLGAPCFYADELSYPGFHVFTIPPKNVKPTWFHYDYAKFVMANEYPHFGINDKSRHLTFTCLLDSPEGLTAGLLYFSDKKLGLKIVQSGVTRNPELRDIATLHEYHLGEMNYYEGLVHSVSGKNDSDVYVDRVTLQGHVIETNKGYLLLR